MKRLKSIPYYLVQITRSARSRLNALRINPLIDQRSKAGTLLSKILVVAFFLGAIQFVDSSAAFAWKTPAPITLSAHDLTVNYGSSDSTTVTAQGGFPGYTFSYSSAIDGVTFEQKDSSTVAIKVSETATPGVYQETIQATDYTTVKSEPVNVIITIKKADRVLTLAPDKPILKFGETANITAYVNASVPKEAMANLGSDGHIQFTTDSSTACSIDPNTGKLTTKNFAGTCFITGVVTGGTYFNDAYASTALEITKDGKPSKISTIYFNTNDGSPKFTTQSGPLGNLITFPSAPSRVGYNFGGWSESPQPSPAPIFQSHLSTPISGNKIYYALWIKPEISNNAIKKTFGSALTAKTSSTSQTTDSSSVGSYTPVVRLNNIAAPVQKRSANSSGANFSIVYSPGQGSGTVPTEGTHLIGDTFTIADSTGINFAGHSFAGWRSESSTVYQPGDSYTVVGDDTLTAQWTTITYNYSILFDSGLGSGTMATQSGNSISFTLNSNTFTRTGYSFVGWKNETNTSYSDGATINLTNDLAMTLTAQWSANNFGITYDSNTADIGIIPTDTNSNPANGSVYTVLGNTGNLEKTGYSFVGWTLSRDGTGTTFNSGDTFTVTNAVTLYAKYVLTDYTFAYSGNGNDGGGAPTGTDDTLAGIHHFGDTVTMPNNFYTKTGYSFSYWLIPTWVLTGNAYSLGGSAGFVNQGFHILYKQSSVTTIFPSWTINSYSVTYFANGATGSVPTQSNVNYQSSFTLESGAGLTKSGYSFAGWSDGTITYQPGDTYTVTAQNVSLAAVWTPNNYSITYSANGSGATGAPGSFTKHIGETFTVGSAATWTGHIFTGWSDGSNTYQPGASYSVGTSDVSLSAQWLLETHTVTYLSGAHGSVSGLSPQTIVYADNSTSVTAVPNSGYHFISWSDGSTSNPRQELNVITDISVTANFVVDTFTVTFLAGRATSGNPPSVTSYDAGTSVTLPSNSGTLARTNWIFAGWSLDSATTPTLYGVGNNFVISQNMVFYPSWKSVLSYDINNGSGSTPSNQEFFEGNSALSLDNGSGLTRSGYNFGGWSTTKDDSSTAVTSYSGGVATRTLYAIWTPITYLYFIKYLPGTGGSGAMSSQSGSAGSVSLTPNSFTRLGYAFTGWKDQSGTSFTDGQSNTFNATFNETLTAQWSYVSLDTPTNVVVTYLGTFDGNRRIKVEWNAVTNANYYNLILSGSGCGSIVGFGPMDSTSVGANPSYTFDWAFSVPSVDACVSAGGNATDTFTAYSVSPSISIPRYTFTYNLAGGSSTQPDPQTLYTADTFTIASAPTRSGYSFKWWSNGSDTYTAGSTFVVGTSDVTFTAQWQAITRTVTYVDTVSGTTLPTQSPVIQGDTFTVAADRSQAGYTFIGWSDGTTNYSGGSTFTVGSTDITLTAQWTRIAYTFNWESGTASGSAPTDWSGPHYYGETLTVPAISYTKTGYQAGAWLLHYSSNTGDQTVAVSVGSTWTINYPGAIARLEPNWTKTAYLRQYSDTAGGTNISNIYVFMDDTFTVASANARSGYSLVGWSDGTNTYQPGDIYTVGTSAITLTAIWTHDTHTVTYVDNSGTGSLPTENSHFYGDSFTVASGSTRSYTGYHFAGWSDGTSTYQAGDTYTVGNSNVTLSATWLIDTFTGTYDFGNGNNSSSHSFNYGLDSITGVVTDPTRSGYDFLGWSTDSSTVITTYNFTGPVTFYAVWLTSLSISGIDSITTTEGFSKSSSPFTSAGGSGTKTFSLQSDPTSGHITIDSSTGVLQVDSTTPANTYSVTVVVTDGRPVTAAKTISVIVNHAISLTISAPPVSTYGTSKTFSTLSASDGTAPYTWGMTPIINGIGIDTSTGVLTVGTAVTPGTYNESVTVTDSLGSQSTINVTFTVNDSMTVTGITNIITNKGRADSTGAVTVNNGTGTKTFSLSSNPLGSHATINASNGSLTIDNSVDSGTYTEVITVTDTAGSTKNFNISVTVHDAVGISGGSNIITTAGHAMTSSQFSITGGTQPETFTISTNGSGATINNSGYVTVPSSTSAGDWYETITATDALGMTQTTSVHILINAMVVVTPITGLTHTQGVSETFTAFTVTGGTNPISYSITHTNTGFSIDPTTGVITLASNALAGTRSESVTATDSLGMADTKTVTFTINSPMSITQLATLEMTQGHAAFTDTLTVTGGTTPYVFSSNNLTSEITLNSTTGRISISGNVIAGTYYETVTVTDKSFATATTVITIHVNNPLTITAGTNVVTTLTRADTSTYFVSAGGYGAKTYSISPGGTGISINSNGQVLVASNASVGTLTETVTVQDAAGATASTSMTITVNAKPLMAGGADTTTTTGRGVNLVPFTASLGTAPLLLSMSGSVSSYITFDSSTGIISVGSQLAAGTYYESVTVTDAYGFQDTKSVTITVNAAISITTNGNGSTVDIYATTHGTGRTYDTLTVSGGTGTKTYSITNNSGGTSINSANGQITLTNSLNVGTYYETITATDSLGVTGTHAITITINNNISISGGSNISTTHGVARSSSAFTATNGTGTYRWSLSGQPAGVSIDTNTGVVYVDSSTVAGTYTITVIATDSVTSQSTTTMTLTEAESIVLSGGVNETTTSGIQETGTAISHTGGTGTITFTMSDNRTGLTIDPTTGVIKIGANAAAGTFYETVTATDSVGATATRSYLMTINAAMTITAGGGALVNYVETFGTNASAPAPVTGMTVTVNGSNLALGSGSGIYYGTGGSGTTTGNFVNFYSSTGTAKFTFPSGAYPTSVTLTADYINSQSDGVFHYIDGTTSTFVIWSNFPFCGGYWCGTATLTGNGKKIDYMTITNTGADIWYLDNITWSASVAGITTTVTIPQTSDSVTVTGGTGTKTFSISPNNLTGITIDSTNGRISAASNTPVGTYTETLTVTDSKGAKTTSQVLVIINDAVSISGPDSITTTQGISMSKTYVANNGTGTKTFTISSNAYGFTVNSSSGVVTIPNNVPAGDYSFTLTATDSVTAFGTKSVTVKVNTIVLIGGGQDTLTTTYGRADTATAFTSSGGTAPRTFSILPNVSGIQIESTSGIVTVAANTSPGTYIETVTVTDSVTAFAWDTITIKVNPAITISQANTSSQNGLQIYFVDHTSTGGDGGAGAPYNATSKTIISPTTPGYCASAVSNLLYMSDGDFPLTGTSCSTFDNFFGYANGYFKSPITGTIHFVMTSDDSSLLQFTVNGQVYSASLSGCCQGYSLDVPNLVAGQYYPFSSWFNENGGAAYWYLAYSWNAQNGYSAQGSTYVPITAFSPAGSPYLVETTWTFPRTSKTISSAGGTGSLTFAMNPTPSGITFDTSTMKVTVDGSVTPGTYFETITGTDSLGVTGSTVFKILVNPRVGITGGSNVTTTFGVPLSSTAYVGQNGTGVDTWTVSGTNSHFTINANTGVLTVDSTTPVGTYIETITVHDTVGDQTDTTTTIVVNDTVTVTGGNTLIRTTRGLAAYSNPFVSSRGTGTLTWSNTSSPTTTHITIASNGVLTVDTTTVAGTYSETVTSTDAVGFKTNFLLTVIVYPEVKVFGVDTMTTTFGRGWNTLNETTTGYTGNYGTDTKTLSMYPLTNPGITFDPATGIIYVDSSTVAGTYYETITATDTLNQIGTRVVKVLVNPHQSITGGGNIVTTFKTPMTSAQFKAINGTYGDTWTIASEMGQGSHYKINVVDSKTVTITADSTTPSDLNDTITLTAIDVRGDTVTTTLTVRINKTITISDGSGIVTTFGRADSSTAFTNALGTGPLVWSIGPDNASGISITQDGVVHVSATTPAGTFRETITVTDSVTSHTDTVTTILVNPAVSVTGAVGVATTITIPRTMSSASVTGGTITRLDGSSRAYIWSISGVSGVTIDSQTGLVSIDGTIAAGTYTETITVKDALDMTGYQTFTLKVNDAIQLSGTSSMVTTQGKPRTYPALTWTGGTTSQQGGLGGTLQGSVSEGGNLTMTAPGGQVFTSVIFASYGTPNNYTISGCNASNSVSIVQSYALNNNTFTIGANNGVFGDPCFGTGKLLQVTLQYGSTTSYRPMIFSMLPQISGITIDTSTGAITIGSGAATGKYWETVTATDSVSATGTMAFSIWVNAPPVMGAISPVITTYGRVDTAVATAATFGTASNTVDDSRGTRAYIYSLSGDTTSALVFDATTGNIRTTATTPAGTYRETVTVTDSMSATSSQTVTIIVNRAISVTGASNIVTTYGTVKTTQASAAYGTTTRVDNSTRAYAYSLSGPEANTNITIDSTTGVVTVGALAGTATAQNIYTETITVTDALDVTGSMTITIRINKSITVTTTSQMVTTSGVARTYPSSYDTYTGTTSYTGGTGSIVYSLSGNNVGVLSINSSTGAITIASGSAANTYYDTITATDSVSAIGIFAFNVLVNQAPQISKNLDIVTTQGRTDSATVTATFGTASNTTLSSRGTRAYIYSLGSGSDTQTGKISIDSATGIITAASTLAYGTYSQNVVVTDSMSATANLTLTVTVNRPIVVSGATNVVTTYTIPQDMGNETATYGTLTRADGTSRGWIWSVSGNNAGVTIDASSGVVHISNTVGSASTTTYLTETITAMDALGMTGSQTFQIRINPSMAFVGTTSMVTTTGIYRQYQETTTGGTEARSGGTGNIAFTIDSAVAGISIGSTTGLLKIDSSTAAGTYFDTITATDSVGAVLKTAVTIYVNVSPQIGGGSDIRTTYKHAQVSTAFTATGGTYSGNPNSPGARAYIYSITRNGGTGAAGNTGISINSATGVISVDTTTTPGTYIETVMVMDSMSATSTTSMTITVYQSVTVTGGSNIITTTGIVETTSAFVANYGMDTKTFSVTTEGGAVSIDPVTGIVTFNGNLNPTSIYVPKVYVETVTAADVNGMTGIDTFTITVNPAIIVQAGSDVTTTHGFQRQSSAFTTDTRTGTGTITWSIGPDTTTGISIDPSTGIVTVDSTTPSYSNIYESVTATDSHGAKSSKAIHIIVNAPIQIGGGSDVTTTFGRADTSTVFTKTDGTTPFTWSISPSVSGITIDQNGYVHVSDSSTVGTWTETVKVQDSIGSFDTKSITVIINAAISVSNGGNIITTQGILETSTAFTKTNGTGTLTFGLTDTITGITIDSNGVVTAATTLTSIDSVTSKTYYDTVTATDTLGVKGYKAFTVKVNPPVLIANGSNVVTTNGVTQFSAAFTSDTRTGTGSKTWTISGNHSGVSISSGGVVTVDSTTAVGTYYETVTVTDQVGAFATKAITIQVNAMVQIGAGNNIVTTFGRADSATGFAADSGTATNKAGSNGTRAYIYTIARNGGAQDSGITIDSVTGIVYVAANTTPGTYIETVTVEDSMTAKSSVSMTIKVNPAITVSGAVNVYTTYQIPKTMGSDTATGGTYTRVDGSTRAYQFSISRTNGSQPAGITIDSGTGLVNIDNTVPVGTYNESITVTDALDVKGYQAFTIQVNTTLTETGTVNMVTTFGKARTYNTITTTGGTSTNVITNGISGSNSSSNGSRALIFTLDDTSSAISIDSTTGAVTIGSTTPDGTYSRTITVTDSASATASMTISILVNKAPVLASAGNIITTYGRADTSTGLVTSFGTASNSSTASRGTIPYVYSFGAGSESITGIAINSSTGAITVSATTPSRANNPYKETITVTDSMSATASFGITILVNDSITISGVTGLVTTYSVPVSMTSDTATGGTTLANGGNANLIFSITDSTTGLSIDPSTGAISVSSSFGSDTNTTYYETITATDSLGVKSTKPFTIKMNKRTTFVGTTTMVTTSGIARTYQETSTDGTSSRSGGTGTMQFTIDSAVAGISIDTTTGLLTIGTLTNAGTYLDTITVTDSVNYQIHQPITIFVNQKIAIVSNDSNLYTTTTKPYSSSAPVIDTSTGTTSFTNGSGSFAFSFASGSDTNTGHITINSSTGVVTADSSTAVGNHVETITVTDSMSATAQFALLIKVNSAVTVNGVARTVYTTYGIGLNAYGETATGGTVLATGGTRNWNFAISGQASGVSIDTTTGVITIPNNIGSSDTNNSYVETVTATDDRNYQAVDTFTIRVNKPLAFSGTTTMVTTQGIARTYQETTTGGTAPNNSGSGATSAVQFTLDVPYTGITIDTTTGLLTIGTNATYGTYYDTITTVDSMTSSLKAPITIYVNKPISITSNDTITYTTANKMMKTNAPVIDNTTGTTINTHGTGNFKFSFASGSDTATGKITIDSTTGIVTVDSATTVGTHYETITVTDSMSATAQFALTVVVNDTVTISAISNVITTWSIAQTILGSSYTVTKGTVLGTGGTSGYVYGISSRTGLGIDTTTGTISIGSNYGDSTTGTTYTETVTVTDNLGMKGIRTFTITVNKPISISDTPTVNAPFETQTVLTYAFTNGSAPITSVITGTIPSGFSWDTSTAGQAKLTIAAHTLPQTVIETITATDSVSATATKVITITVLKGQRTATISPSTLSIKYGETASVTTVFSATNTTGDGGTYATDGTLTYSIADTSTTCSIDPVTGVISADGGVGTCKVKSVRTAGTNYDSVTSNTLSVTIAKADTITVTLGALSVQTYNSGVITSNVTAQRSFSVSGLKNGDTYTASGITYNYVDSLTTCAMGGTCSIGQVGPGGGIVFYVDTGTPGWGKYLEAAPVNWEGGDTNTPTAWCNTSTLIDRMSSAIGDGLMNTNSIYSKCASSAAGIARAYTGGNQTNWYLPTSLELAQMWTYRNNLSLVTSGSVLGYWASDETTTSNANVLTVSGSISNAAKSDATHYMIRPIRAFVSVTGTTGTPTTNIPTTAGFYQESATSLVLSNTTNTRAQALVSTGNYQAVVFVPTPLTITKINQDTLTLVEGALGEVGKTFNLDNIKTGGSGSGAVSYKVVGGTAAGCSISSNLLSATGVGVCYVSATKASDNNYYATTSLPIPVKIGFQIFVNPFGVQSIGSGPNIGISGQIARVNDTETAPNAGNVQVLTGVAGGSYKLYGVGFTDINLIKIARISVASFTIDSSTQITFVISNSNITGPITVYDSAGGFTIAADGQYFVISNPVISITGGTITGTNGSPITSYTIVNNNPGSPASSYSISPGLPAGLSFDTSSGLISGTPTATLATTTFTVTASGGGGSTTATFTLTIN